MNAIITLPPVITQAVSLPSPPAAAVLPNPGMTSAQAAAADPPDFLDIQAADQKRLESVQKAAQNIANVYVVGDKIFTIFKDVTGQYITRFTSLRDGKVTYVPEPELFKQGGDSAPTIKIQA